MQTTTETGAGTDASQANDLLSWKIRAMRHEDLDRCLDIWHQVELTEAHSTVASVLATDPEGFYVAELENGEVVGMCAGPLTRPDTAFMGFYAVLPRYQSLGIGRELWAKTVARLGESKNIGLHGVPAMSAKYKKSGFYLEDPVRMLIYESFYTSSNEDSKAQKHEIYPERLMSLEERNLELSTRYNNKWLLINEKNIGQITEAIIFERLVEYDEYINRFSRRSLLRNYLLGDNVPLTAILLMPRRKCKQKTQVAQSEAKSTMVRGPESNEAPSHTVQRQTSIGDGKTSGQQQQNEEVALSSCVDHYLKIETPRRSNNDDDNDDDDDEGAVQIVGYGCIRHDSTGGGVIGPLYANTDEYCELILGQLIEHFPLPLGGKYSVMSLTSNPVASAILEKIGLKQMDQCSRMFTKFVPEANLSNVYFVHSPNFTLF